MVAGRLIAVLGLLATARASLYSLQDSPSTRPSLATGPDTVLPLAWWDGGPAFVLASAGAVRVNYRGVVVYPPNARVRANVSGWHGVACNTSAWALCSSDVGQVFPYRSPRVPERRESVQVDGWNDLSCAQSEGKIVTAKGFYDVSACDIFDEGLDVLYSAGNVYHRHSPIPTWEYWALVLLAIVLVRSLSYNIQALWHDGKVQQAEHPSVTTEQWPALLASLALLILILVRGDAAYVTSADQLFFWSSAAYVLIYLAIHVSERVWKQAQEEGDDEEDEAGRFERPVYNILVATLQLVAMRFYSGAETPYNVVLLGMLACRAW